MNAALEIVRVHHAQMFIILCSVGSTLGIVAFVWIMIGGWKR